MENTGFVKDFVPNTTNDSFNSKKIANNKFNDDLKSENKQKFDDDIDKGK